MNSRLKEYCPNFIRHHRTLIENMSYMTLLQVFLMIAPLITYPYLVRVLGMEVYGWVLTAQMLASYFSILIDFGSNSVCAKHVAIAKGDKVKLSEVVCSVFYTRFGLAVIGFFIYSTIILVVPSYREHAVLFVLSYGMTLNELLFPQYFYQGIEKMKLTAITNVVIKLIFIALIFVVVHSPEDYIFVPIFYAIGYGIAGLIAMWIIFYRLNIPFSKPSWAAMKIYIKDSAAIFATDVVCTIKDKVNYLLVGICVGMESVVVYDLGLKLNSILNQPNNIIRTVIFPRGAQTRNLHKIIQSIIIIFFITLTAVVLANIFLSQIVTFFIGSTSIDLLPLRLLLIAPVMLSISLPIATNVFIALGYNKFVLYSIIFTTIIYLIALCVFWLFGHLNSVYSFIYIALISYLTELIYRLLTFKKIIKIEQTLN